MYITYPKMLQKYPLDDELIWKMPEGILNFLYSLLLCYFEHIQGVPESMDKVKKYHPYKSKSQKSMVVCKLQAYRLRD